MGERIAVFGAGYAGLVTGAGFADLGHQVVVRDVVPDKVDALRAGRVPFHEPGLEEVIARVGGRLRFTLDSQEAVEGARFVFVCVGTPATYSGDADLSAVWTVLDELRNLADGAVVVMKSTVPVGTGDKVRAALDARGLTHIGYVSNPEFLAEGSAVKDFLEPDRIVIGSFQEADGDAVERLHEGLEAPIVRTDVPSAEMVKLAANAYLGTRISFINEIANVCELVGADVEKVAWGMGLDSRIGTRYLQAGIGFGGSCLVGEETVLVRDGRAIRLATLEDLFESTGDGNDIEILTWRPDGDGAEFLPVALLTRRHYEGDVIDVKTKMGRRVTCTADHPLITRKGRRLADEITTDDWLPLAQGRARTSPARPRRMNVIRAFESIVAPHSVIVRPAAGELAAIGAREIGDAVAHLSPSRSEERAASILRNGTLRLDEAAELDIEIEDATFATARAASAPATIDADAGFWRIVGLYLAEGHAPVDPRNGHRRLQWCFHPTQEQDLVHEVVAFWASYGVEASVYRAPTTTIVRVSSRIVAEWWVNDLGLGRNCYEQRLPDSIWDESNHHKLAVLTGAWLGDGSWSFVNGGPSIVFEYGTVSRELADGMLRLLGDVGIVARLKIGRTAKSTTDTYWLVISGADQVERVLTFAPEEQRSAIVESLARQTKRIAPTGYIRDCNAAWLRVSEVKRRPFSGFVYSLEVPPTHSFATTGGLIVSNCFPKDISFLKLLAGNSGYHFQLLNSVIEVNELQKRRVVSKLQKHLGSLRGKTIALLGLAFKANTDDMREAPSIVLASRLLAEGADVRTWDPVADASSILRGVTFADTVLEAVRDADAAVVVTGWDELRDLPRAEIRDAMRVPLIVDGRNVVDPEAAKSAGFTYEGIGRASTSPLAGLPETDEPVIAEHSPEA
ncbi:MAG TPA: nucleotide sugar dehydrogenase [Gaiellaceae bacterium]|nr:nucleotide sugar dehydrogenase [Gaiellaceae bacterium]